MTKKDIYPIIQDTEAKFEYSAGTIIHDGIYHLPHQISSLNKIYLLLNYEKDKDSLTALFHMYVFNLCSFLECFIKMSYRDSLNRNRNKIFDSQHLHLIEEAEIRLQGLTWENLKNAANLYLEEDIPIELKESSTFKGIIIMFALRNLIIHGNLFEKDIINNNDGFKYQVSGKASKIYAFFIENDLMKQTEIEFLDHYELNAKSVHFFIENVLQFVQEYSSFMQPKLSFNYLDIFNKMGLFEINYSVLKN